MIRVRCEANDLESLPTSVRERLSQSIWTKGAIDPLQLGHEYDVWALVRWDDGLRVYIDWGEYWPSPYPIEFFSVIRADIPSGWLVTFTAVAERGEIDCISFPEWCEDRYFYERLLDCDPAAVSIYQSRRSDALAEEGARSAENRSA